MSRIDQLGSVLGFTGSIHSLRNNQLTRMAYLIPGFDTATHGDCIGGDAAFHAMCLIRCTEAIVIYPPSDPKLRAYCHGSAVTLMPTAPYLERNKSIINLCHKLLACPDGPERLRSGTWSTIRYAIRTGMVVGKDIEIVLPAR